ncbi:MAG: SpoIIE family protein phosphatase [Bacteroidales bacterium]|nr:SpoIIE family protein phosphatase [Bacteroidales bacterium]
MSENKRPEYSGRNVRRWLGIFLSNVLVVSTMFAQQVRFQNFSVTEGLRDPYVYNIVQDKNGFIWLGTGRGLCRYDGHEFFTPTLKALPEEEVYISFVDNLGKLWFGFSNGEVWSYDGNNYSSYVLDKEKNITIKGITQSDELGVIIATQNQGLYHFNSDGKPVKMDPAFENQQLTAVHVCGNTLLAGDMEGLFITELGRSADNIQRIGELSYVQIQTIRDAYKGNSFWIGTYDEGLYYLEILKDSIYVEKLGIGREMEYLRVKDITYDADSGLLVCAANAGVFRIDFEPGSPTNIISVRNFNEANGLKTDNVECLYLDHEKNLWFGTNGEGLSLQTNQFFGFYDMINSGAGVSVLSVSEDEELLWIGGTEGLVSFNKHNGKRTHYTTGLPKDAITSLFYQKGILWIGTSNNGIYKYQNGNFNNFLREANSISNAINHITGDAQNLYAATKNGIFVINKQTGEKSQFTTIDGLPHNDIEFLYLDNQKRLLFATRTDGIYELDAQRVRSVFTVEKYELEFNSITEDEKGNLWVSTYGQGLFLLPGHSDSIINIRDDDGLKSNYCYGMISDRHGFIWTGHRGGLSRIDINNRKITIFDSDNGITGDCNSNGSFLSQNSKLYFGTTEGLAFYDLEGRSVSKSAPVMNILKVVISDIEYPKFNEPIVLPYSAYKLRIDYVGLYYSDPESVRYQYKLEGHDLGWSDLTDERTVTYPRLEDGEYTFLVKAISPDGTVSQISSQLHIRVKPPFWKQWWFITLLFVILILAIIVIIKYRERKQKQIQEYLEQRLDERTREVVEQKEEIEIKNRDITDSINYAQRIQSSILPPIKRLQQYFDGSFVFYQPRDIVSGDFYWFDKISESKFVIVCADSTGHGVPGAFMSMIGTTLIKDICMRQEINSPCKILEELDIELRNMLNQNVDAEQSNDGMDIIVCELDTRTMYLRYASAMRPMIVYRGGDQIYIKGSRSSVGGQYDKEEKDFRDEGMQLNKGDLIYMFSDGYPDQFGGAVGKKFKMVRLKNLLKDIHQKPMEEQYEYVRSTFNLWKEDFEQVDDVLFMGIKL